MPEKTLNLPLSGEEVRCAVLKKIGDALMRDCHLSPNMAYDWFRAHVTATLELHDIGRGVDIEVDISEEQGEQPAGIGGAPSVELEIEPTPPNQVRVDTGQPVPVLVQDGEGKPEIKSIKYKRSTESLLSDAIGKGKK
jgi:hypothetical protein